MANLCVAAYRLALISPMCRGTHLHLFRAPLHRNGRILPQIMPGHNQFTKIQQNQLSTIKRRSVCCAVSAAVGYGNDMMLEVTLPTPCIFCGRRHVVTHKHMANCGDHVVVAGNLDHSIQVYFWDTPVTTTCENLPAFAVDIHKVSAHPRSPMRSCQCDDAMVSLALS